MSDRIRLVLVLVLACVKPSVCVLCFSGVNRTSGQCGSELGEVDQDDCCLDVNNGFQERPGVCQSCGHPVWTSWSPWSSCNLLCGDGVRQRRRICFGIGRCDGRNEVLQMEPCVGVCCEATGWVSWNPWSPCSRSCGDGGARRRARVCGAPPGCHETCDGGAAEETEPCPQMKPCPVHGGWTQWSGWSLCSGPCISAEETPDRLRSRSCSDPAPSNDTEPPGQACPGENSEVRSCTEMNDCPVDGNWGPWSPPGPCTAVCGAGLQLIQRPCDNPAPKYGGKFCVGPGTITRDCVSECPVDGSWSGWSHWGECSASCVPEGGRVTRTRRHFCTNPAPSAQPPGNVCPGAPTDVQTCQSVPPCSVDGAWGAWSPFSACPVTCGLGLQLSVRNCDRPPPKHGGQPCPGENRRSQTCNTRVYCPVDGQWSAWGSWGKCQYAHDDRIDISCSNVGGIQWKTRKCLHRSSSGSACRGGEDSEYQVCYNVQGCDLQGDWAGWGPWTWCKPTCGPRSTRRRLRICSPDYSEYSPTIGLRNDKASFSGTPNTVACKDHPEGEDQTQPCLNASPCS